MCPRGVARRLGRGTTLFLLLGLAACSEADDSASADAGQPPYDSSDAMETGGGVDAKGCPWSPPRDWDPCDGTDAGPACQYATSTGCCGEPGQATFKCSNKHWMRVATTCPTPSQSLCPSKVPEAGAPCDCSLTADLQCCWLGATRAACTGSKWVVLAQGMPCFIDGG